MARFTTRKLLICLALLVQLISFARGYQEFDFDSCIEMFPHEHCKELQSTAHLPALASSDIPLLPDLHFDSPSHPPPPASASSSSSPSSSVSLSPASSAISRAKKGRAGECEVCEDCYEVSSSACTGIRDAIQTQARQWKAWMDSQLSSSSASSSSSSSSPATSSKQKKKPLLNGDEADEGLVDDRMAFLVTVLVNYDGYQSLSKLSRWRNLTDVSPLLRQVTGGSSLQRVVLTKASSPLTQLITQWQWEHWSVGVLGVVCFLLGFWLKGYMNARSASSLSPAASSAVPLVPSSSSASSSSASSSSSSSASNRHQRNASSLAASSPSPSSPSSLPPSALPPSSSSLPRDTSFVIGRTEVRLMKILLRSAIWMTAVLFMMDVCGNWYRQGQQSYLEAELGALHPPPGCAIDDEESVTSNFFKTSLMHVKATFKEISTGKTREDPCLTYRRHRANTEGLRLLSVLSSIKWGQGFSETLVHMGVGWWPQVSAAVGRSIDSLWSELPFVAKYLFSLPFWLILPILLVIWLLLRRKSTAFRVKLPGVDVSIGFMDQHPNHPHAQAPLLHDPSSSASSSSSSSASASSSHARSLSSSRPLPLLTQHSRTSSRVAITEVEDEKVPDLEPASEASGSESELEATPLPPRPPHPHRQRQLLFQQQQRERERRRQQKHKARSSGSGSGSQHHQHHHHSRGASKELQHSRHGSSVNSALFMDRPIVEEPLSASDHDNHSNDEASDVHPHPSPLRSRHQDHRQGKSDSTVDEVEMSDGYVGVDSQ